MVHNDLTVLLLYQFFVNDPSDVCVCVYLSTNPLNHLVFLFFEPVFAHSIYLMLAHLIKRLIKYKLRWMTFALIKNLYKMMQAVYGCAMFTKIKRVDSRESTAHAIC